MVATGRTKGGFPDYTQVVDITDDTKSCPNWDAYPKPVIGATGSVMYISPVICGGGYDGDSYDKCHLLDLESKKWTFLTTMTANRSNSASVAINGSLFITGGKDENKDNLASTEYVHMDGVVSPGPDLPAPRSRHCMVTLPSGKVMIIGGYDYGNLRSVMVLDPDTNKFESLPSLIHKRNGLGCAVFNSPLHEFRPIVLVASGNFDSIPEIYDFTLPNSKWTESKIV